MIMAKAKWSMAGSFSGLFSHRIGMRQKRASAADRPIGPKAARSTVLSTEEEAIVVASGRRRHPRPSAARRQAATFVANLGGGISSERLAARRQGCAPDRLCRGARARCRWGTGARHAAPARKRCGGSARSGRRAPGLPGQPSDTPAKTPAAAVKARRGYKQAHRQMRRGNSASITLRGAPGAGCIPMPC